MREVVTGQAVPNANEGALPGWEWDWKNQRLRQVGDFHKQIRTASRYASMQNQVLAAGPALLTPYCLAPYAAVVTTLRGPQRPPASPSNSAHAGSPTPVKNASTCTVFRISYP